MKAHLLFRDQDVELERPLPWNQEALTQDLALNTLFNAMARDDKFVFEVSKKVILSGLQNGLDTILYRQEILNDCLYHPGVVRDLYAVAVEATEVQKKHYFSSYLSRSPDWSLRYSIELLEALLPAIKKLRKIADSHAGKFASDGWTVLFSALQRELSDEYFAVVQQRLQQLKFRYGVLLSAHLGKGNKGANYLLHLLQVPRRRSWDWLIWAVKDWLKDLFRWRWLTRFRDRTKPPDILEFSLDPRDEAGVRALAELRDRGISLVAIALAQSADHVRSFFDMLRAELAFYIGCLNLHEQLRRWGADFCFPVPVPTEERRLSFCGLYDVCLTLNLRKQCIGNDTNADRKDIIIITGANQGGKSTFLRSLGLAQLMMQCGMFVTADSFCASLQDGLFTHYKREEDISLNSGKLDEELARMSDIIDHLAPHSMVLFNESFAATNEREGSEIARQIVSALVEKAVRIVYVTHLYEFAKAFHDNKAANVLFLRAPREADGSRTFKLIEAEPLETSFGEDLYASIFGANTCPSDTRANGAEEQAFDRDGVRKLAR
jgi:hypothetical protein